MTIVLHLDSSNRDPNNGAAPTDLNQNHPKKDIKNIKVYT